MSTAGLFSVPGTTPRVSFELYPPRSPAAQERLTRTVAELAAARPDFFSVTYGAAGRTHATSRGLIRQILAETDVTPIAHLTCVGASREELRVTVEELLEDGVRDVLALRGDPPTGGAPWEPHPRGLTRAAELVGLLREIESERFELAEGQPRPLSISVAAYPARTFQAAQGSVLAAPRDLEALHAKQEAGADFAITQLFYSAPEYAAHVEAARAAGIRLPIVPGVIPLTDLARLQRLTQLTGVPVPEALELRLSAARDADEQYRIGLAASIELVEELLAVGAPGLHLYTFNTSRAALDLLRGAGLREPAPSTSAAHR
ncbi:MULTISPECIES: methylenetetrahydrofolate reductase [unclassified Pseudactinotalea]|uniref:methylenetetrahydrofolate reductase n=1 Tax=unclassified Pseudactinotalea TaxID=2649176 RepID=UPI00128B65A9|nr:MULTISPECIES: methylenetetrahydrofolate reductase [unclassified Pseudactinotalea]MPV49092.1 methylenetetrahydrofolate reductase [Pseudactinotalea sp. HY160]QGH68233.1 methylenetetrahydrofolate reductase [Pseudactinotalea sp. HY158]